MIIISVLVFFMVINGNAFEALMCLKYDSKSSKKIDKKETKQKILI